MMTSRFIADLCVLAPVWAAPKLMTQPLGFERNDGQTSSEAGDLTVTSGAVQTRATEKSGQYDTFALADVPGGRRHPRPRECSA
jgi:hypothetical protein